MSRYYRIFGLLAGLGLLWGLGPWHSAQAADGFADTAFRAVWERTDNPISTAQATRTWLWGPKPGLALFEEYGSPGSTRLVQYFDKSRMEVNLPGGDRASQWYVTNGLLARELISGQRQTSDTTFRQFPAARIPSVGDPDDLEAPTYADLANVTTLAAGQNRAPAALNTLLNTSLDRQGRASSGGSAGGTYGLRVGFYENQTGHNIAQPFWDFLNSSGPLQTAQGGSTTGRLFDPLYFATGLPLSEPYWVHAKVGGKVQDVLLQVFERRLLTYTPGNSPQWRVEMGNIGQHYFSWRYGTLAAFSFDPRHSLTVTAGLTGPILEGQLATLGAKSWYSYGLFPIEQNGQPVAGRVQMVRTGKNYVFAAGPETITAFQALVRATPAGSYWQVGNEPNVPGQDEAAPEEYARQYETIRGVIREIDPTARLVGPNILNWNYTCNGCPGYAQGDGWTAKMIAAFQAQTGREIDFEVWSIHTYGLNWAKLPLADYRQDVAQTVALREYLRTLPNQAGKPIWITEYGVIWGYDDIKWNKVGDEWRAKPGGTFQRQALLDYIHGYADWLKANSNGYGIERWFIYTNFGLPEPYTDTFTGISLFSSAASPQSELSDFGALFRATALYLKNPAPGGAP